MMLRDLFCFLALLFLAPISFYGSVFINKKDSFQKNNTSGFTENKGQVGNFANQPQSEVQFVGVNQETTFFLKETGISYQLQRVQSWKRPADLKEMEQGGHLAKNAGLVPDQLAIYRVDVDWLHANRKPEILKELPMEGYTNYYLSCCPNGALGVKTYGAVTYRNVYKGIDLKWYFKNGQLKYDYLVGVGGDYTHIQLKVTGAEKISINQAGELTLKTPFGNIVEQAPIVIQEGKVLIARWVIRQAVLSFDIEDLDPGRPFVIDPGVRTWGTYYGGHRDEFGKGCTVDKQGNVFFAGNSDGSYTTSIISTPGAFQLTSSGPSAFLVKFNSAGQRLWGTHYGGSFLGYTSTYCCSADPDGNVYISGTTSSTLGVSTGNSHQPNCGGGNDGFLAKFDANGIRLWGTYVGGSGADAAFSCATDSLGNVYVAGVASSSTGIASPNAQQSGFVGGSNDAFLIKFNALGQRQWGTYYGGADGEAASSCATDRFGNVFITGFTLSESTTNIATAGSHQPFKNGNHSAFLAKFNSNGQRQWGTYYDGNNYTSATCCVADVAGNVYMTGSTGSVFGISTASGHQTNLSSNPDGFLVKFDGNGIRQWGTYYGGIKEEVARSCATDFAGNVYMCGATNTSGTMLATPGTQQSSVSNNFDAFLVSFGPDGVRHWGTYYGGPGEDEGSSCTVDKSGTVYLSGRTSAYTGNSLATAGSHQPLFGGRDDAFFVQFNNCLNPSPDNPFQLTVQSSLNSPCSGQSVTLTAMGTSSATWMPGANVTSSLSLIANTDLNYTVTGVDGRGCKSIASFSLPVGSTPTLSATPFFYLCSGSASLMAVGAETFSWFPGNSTGSLVLVSPAATMQYSVLGANGTCTALAVSIVSVGLAPDFLIASSAQSGCRGSCFSVSALSDLFSPTAYFFGDGVSAGLFSATHCYTNAGNYQITAYATYTSGCHVTSANVIDVTVFPTPIPNILVNTQHSFYEHDPVPIQNLSTGAQLFKWDFDDSLSHQTSWAETELNHTYNRPGNYCIKLIATDTIYGCSDSTVRCIDILCYSSIIMPNVFTPNDDGVNDVFKFTTRCVNKLTCNIYNRWGIMIRSFTGINGGWDGRTDSGVPASDGTYFFVLEYLDDNKEVFKKHGSIYLTR